MKILLASDLGESSQNAFDYAAQLFSENVFEKTQYYLIHAFHETESRDEKKAIALFDYEYHRLNKLLPNLEKHFKNGSVKHIINSFIRDHHIDLIIMGSREKSLENKLAVGSNAVEISAHAHCSVLVIPADVTIKKPTKIAFGSDYHKMNVPRETLGILKNLIKAHNAKLAVFHVYKEGDKEQLKKELKANVSHHFVEKVDHEYHVILNHEIYLGIDAFIEKEHPDILTVIPREHSFISELHNPSITKQMSFDVKIPLLVLR